LLLIQYYLINYEFRLQMCLLNTYHHLSTLTTTSKHLPPPITDPTSILLPACSINKRPSLTVLKVSQSPSYSVTSSYTVSHHHAQCHIIIHSVTSSYIVSLSLRVSQSPSSPHHPPLSPSSEEQIAERRSEGGAGGCGGALFLADSWQPT
jgi:hypothetical protein